MNGPMLAMIYALAAMRLENTSDEVSGRLSAGASMELDALQDDAEDAAKALLRRLVNERRASIKAAIVQELSGENVIDGISEAEAGYKAEGILNAIYQS